MRTVSRSAHRSLSSRTRSSMRRNIEIKKDSYKTNGIPDAHAFHVAKKTGVNINGSMMANVGASIYKRERKKNNKTYSLSKTGLSKDNNMAIGINEVETENNLFTLRYRLFYVLPILMMLIILLSITIFTIITIAIIK